MKNPERKLSFLLKDRFISYLEQNGIKFFIYELLMLVLFSEFAFIFSNQFGLQEGLLITIFFIISIHYGVKYRGKIWEQLTKTSAKKYDQEEFEEEDNYCSSSMADIIWEKNTINRQMLVDLGFRKASTQKILEDLDREGILIKGINNKRILSPEITRDEIQRVMDNIQNKGREIEIIRTHLSPSE